MDDSTFRLRFEDDYKSMYSGASPDAFTALDFVGALGSVREGLLYSRLFLPQFIEVDGMVFLEDIVQDVGGADGIRKLRSQASDAQDLEQNLNTFNINLNFPNRLKDSMDGDDMLLAEQLAEAWGLRLRQLYPDRTFVVESADEGGEAILRFYQSRAKVEASRENQQVPRRYPKAEENDDASHRLKG